MSKRLGRWGVSRVDYDTLDVIRNVRGWDRDNPDYMGDISYDEPTQTMTIAPKTGKGYFEFWSDGVRFKKTASISIAHADTTGAYYYYFDSSGVLQVALNSSLTFDIFTKNAITYLNTWNATTQKAIIQAKDEQHGIKYNSINHFIQHETRNLQSLPFKGTLDIQGLTDGGSTYTKTTSGFGLDEDILFQVPELATHPWIYRDGATGEWVESAADNNVCFMNSTANMHWNEWDGSTWKLTAATNTTDYAIIPMILTNDVNNPWKKIVPQQITGSRSNARNLMKGFIKALSLDGLVSPESMYCYFWIGKKNGTLEDSGSPANLVFEDFRNADRNAIG